jgi:hypothetical protein
MKRQTILVGLVVVSVLIALVGLSVAASGQLVPQAQVQAKINYQGRLTDPSGQPLSGQYLMRFQLHDDPLAGSLLWESGDIVVDVDHGLFNVELGVDPTDFDGQGLWLRIFVNGEWLTPRQALLPVPYALSLRPGATISGEGTSSLLVRNSSTGDGAKALQASASGASGLTYGMVGLSNSTSGRGVLGHAKASSGVAYGVVGRTESSGDSTAGVYGYAPAASGRTFGVIGRTDSSDDWATGVQGHASAASGQTYGIRGYSASAAGRGVAGHASATSGVTYGVYGQTDSDSDGAAGVRGHASATSGVTYGVWGQTDSDSENAAGVVGYSSGDEGRGVIGQKYGGPGIAVDGYNYGKGSGVCGSAVAWVGVWGETDAVSGDYGFYTPDNLHAANFHTTGAVMQVVQNGGSTPLELGDVVRFSGMVDAGTADGTPLAQVSAVTRADDSAVAGVVYKGYDWEAVRRRTASGYDPYDPDAGPESTLEGLVEPGEYLLLIVQGPAPVKASAVSGAIRPGGLLSTAGLEGHAALAPQVEISGIRLTPPGIVVGKALEPLEGDRGLIYVFVTLQ